MHDGIRYEFSSGAQLDPFNLNTTTVRADASGRDHHMLAPDASDSHQLPLGAVMVERLNCGIRKLTHALAPL